MDTRPDAEQKAIRTSAADADLDVILQSLPQQIAPASELWPAIESRLGLQIAAASTTRALPPARLRLGWAVAAAVGAVWFAGMWIPESGPEPGHESARTASESLFAEQFIARSYEQQKSLQLADISAIPASYGDWQQQLSIWDDAIAQIHIALDFYPHDPALLQQLDQLYRQQLAYLRQLNAVAANDDDARYY